MTLKNWPPLRPLMLLALVLSVTGCAPTQTRWLAPQSPEIPMLPMEARQGPAPSICLPTCSAGLAAELEALAGVADRARIAGLTCERAYEAVRGNVRP